MSYMSIDLDSLKDIEKRVGSLSKSLEQIKNSLSTVRSNIDSTVRNRSGIDSSMSSLIREVGERERIMNNVKQFLKETIKQYEDMEKELRRESDRIIENSTPKTGIIKSILNGLKSIGKKLGNLLKTIAKNSILLSPVIVGTPVVIIGKILAERGFIVTNEPTEIIKKNDKGIPILEGILSYSPFEFNPYVVLLQKRLIELGYGDGIKVNGRLDSKTLKAVNKYKEDYGLWNFGEYEGKVGETTWNHMFNNEKVPYIGDFESTDDLISDDVPPLSGILSYNPNVYSEEVLMMQRRLNEIYAGVSGYKKIKEDGYFGPETLEAVNRYKEEYGLWNFGEYEGKVGETTWNHLFKSETPKVSNNSGVSINSGNKDVDRMLSIATEQWGYREKGENLTPYGEWYGMNGQPWCVMFISWCADQAGILGTVVPKEAHAFYMKQGYIKDGRYRERESGYIPRAGDTIIFSKGVTGTDPVSRENKEYYHGAIVVGYDPETETVYTIEGNKGDEVRYCAYNLRFVEIDGYGINGGTTNGFIPENIYSYKASTY